MMFGIQKFVGKITAFFGLIALINNIVMRSTRMGFSLNLFLNETVSVILIATVLFVISIFFDNRRIRFMQCAIFFLIATIGFMITIESSTGILFGILTIILSFMYGFLVKRTWLKIGGISGAFVFAQLFAVAIGENPIDGIRGLIGFVIMVGFVSIVLYSILRAYLRKILNISETSSKIADKALDAYDRALLRADEAVTLAIELRRILKEECEKVEDRTA